MNNATLTHVEAFKFVLYSTGESIVNGFITTPDNQTGPVSVSKYGFGLKYHCFGDPRTSSFALTFNFETEQLRVTFMSGFIRLSGLVEDIIGLEPDSNCLKMETLAFLWVNWEFGRFIITCGVESRMSSFPLPQRYAVAIRLIFVELNEVKVTSGMKLCRWYVLKPMTSSYLNYSFFDNTLVFIK